MFIHLLQNSNYMPISENFTSILFKDLAVIEGIEAIFVGAKSIFIYILTLIVIPHKSTKSLQVVNSFSLNQFLTFQKHGG